MNKPKFLITTNLIKFTAYGIVYQVRPSHSRFTEISDLLKAGKTRACVTAYNKGLKNEAKSGFLVAEDRLHYKGTKLPEVFAEVYKVVSASAAGGYLKALEMFFDSIISNPSQVSVEAFARFLKQRRMPVTDRGTFLAYKRIRADWTDCHSGSFDNRPGTVVKMERSRVDANQYAECSYGFHACSFEYLKEFGGDRIVVVEIAPHNVVAVPPDYRNTKMRVCEYTVLCTLTDFKKMLMDRSQDVLGNLPFLRTDQLKNYDFTKT